MRHMIMHYPEDEKVLDYPYQFMLGPDFLVAPVTEPGINEKSVYLPKGQWVHLFSNTQYDSAEGQLVNVATPLGKPAVFYKNGSIYGEQIQQGLAGLGPINFP